MITERPGLHLQQTDEEREDTNTKREYGSVNRRRTNYNQTTNNNLPNIIYRINDRASRTPLKPKVNSGSPEELAVPVPLVELVVLLLSQTRRYFMNG
jgi:hypothetical protein